MASEGAADGGGRTGKSASTGPIDAVTISRSTGHSLPFRSSTPASNANSGVGDVTGVAAVTGGAASASLGAGGAAVLLATTDSVLTTMTDAGVDAGVLA